MAQAIDWHYYAALKAQGLADREIARQWGIPWGTFHREKQRYTAAHPSTPDPQPTGVHLSTPPPDDVAVRPLSLLPDLEVIVARERDASST